MSSDEIVHPEHALPTDASPTADESPAEGAPQGGATAVVHPEHASLADELLDGPGTQAAVATDGARGRATDGRSSIDQSTGERFAGEQSGDGPYGDGQFTEQPTDQPADQRDLVLSARDLQLAGREAMVFGPVDLDLRRGSIGMVVGQQGSGRSALLLALAGRLKGVQGSLQVGDIDGIHHPRQLRKVTSVARITELAELEPNLTVGESRDERAIADGIGQRHGRERFSELESLLGHHFQTEQWIDRMPAVERTLLTLVLSCLSPARFVVFDDIDDSLTEPQLREMYEVLQILVEEGNNFVVSALDKSQVPASATVLRLASPTPRSQPDFLPMIRRTAPREDA